jgi:transcriptional regulator with XRE-family HTH domain
MLDGKHVAGEYDPNRLFDTLIDRLCLKNDAALCRKLDISQPVVSKIRNAMAPVGASMLLRMHETTGIDIAQLRELMGDRRSKYRLSKAQRRTESV